MFASTAASWEIDEYMNREAEDLLTSGKQNKRRRKVVRRIRQMKRFVEEIS